MSKNYVVQHKNIYLCIVFFMVLDLRLTMKIGCRDDNLFFFTTAVSNNRLYPPIL
jgi:hypothetical protein